MIRFYNARVLTMEQGIDMMENAEVWTDGDKISFVGKPDKQQLDRTEFERQTDLNDLSAILCRRYAPSGLAFQTGLSHGGKA